METIQLAKNCFTPTVFHRNERILRILLINDRAWLCAQDLGRLMGIGLVDHRLAKLDADQQCTLTLMTGGHARERVMVSDCGAFALLVYHLIPENRALRRWLSCEVLPSLRSSAR